MTGLQADLNHAKVKEICMKDAEGDALPRPFERYILLKRLARGGMGELFLGYADGTIDGAERPCVVKVIRREHVEDTSFVARFLDEARIQSQLEHPGVVRVLDASRDAQGKPYVVLEHVEGRNLSELRLRAQQLGVRIGWADAVAIAIAMTDALCHVHERTDAEGRPLEIVHRDLSPQNVMVSYGGDVRVIDFGTARGQNRRCHTVSGIVFAKPGYVAPEVANGNQGGIPADLYAVGVMLWELVAGRRFISGEAGEHLAAVASGSKTVAPLAEAVGAPPEFDLICQKLTATQLVDRFESAREASLDLVALLKRAPSMADGQRSVRARISHLMQRLYPAEPARTRAEFARLVADAKQKVPPPSAELPAPSPAPLEIEEQEPQLLPGTRYRLGELLGAGSTGQVFEATHVDLERRVALKLLTARQPEALEAFRREAKMVAQLRHENIVAVHDFGMTSDKSPYLAMELLDGQSLAEFMARNGRPDARLVLKLAIQVCRALDAAHRASVVHGDVKPANLFLTRGGQVKLLDFGVTNWVTSRDDEQSGQSAKPLCLYGTPAYMAPEQTSGAPATASSDLYALGVVLYELLTGTLPHPADALGELLLDKRRGAVLPPSQRLDLSEGRALHKEVDQIVLRLLETNPARRYPTAAAAELALESALRTTAHAARRPRPRRATLVATAALCTLLVGLPGVAPEITSDAIATVRASMPKLSELGSIGLESGARSWLSAVGLRAQSKRPIVEGQGEGAAQVSLVPPIPPELAVGLGQESLSRGTAPGQNTGLPTEVAAEEARVLSPEVGAGEAGEEYGPPPSSDDRQPAAGVAEPSDSSTELTAWLERGQAGRVLTQLRKDRTAAWQREELLAIWLRAANETRAFGEAFRVAARLHQLAPTVDHKLALARATRTMGHVVAHQQLLREVLALDPENQEAARLLDQFGARSRVALR